MAPSELPEIRVQSTTPPQRRPRRALRLMLLSCLLGLAATTLTPTAWPRLSEAFGQDPIERAHDHLELLRGWKKIVRDRLQQLQQDAKNFQLPTRQREGTAARQLAEAIPPLRAAGQWLVDQYPQFEQDQRGYRASLGESGPVLQAAADQYRGLAAEQTDQRIATQYEAMAAESERLAEALANELAEYNDESSRFADKIAFVQESLVLLDHLEQFLLVYHNPDRIAVNEYLRQLNDYLEVYEEVFRTFQEIRNLADENAAPNEQHIT